MLSPDSAKKLFENQIKGKNADSLQQVKSPVVLKKREEESKISKSSEDPLLVRKVHEAK